MQGIKCVILDYEAGDLILQVKAAQSSIRDGRPSANVCGVVFGLGTGSDKAFAVKWNKDSVRVYPQDKR